MLDEARTESDIPAPRVTNLFLRGAVSTNGRAAPTAQPSTAHQWAGDAQGEDAAHALRLVAVILEDNSISSLQYCRDACLAVIADALGLDMPVSVDSLPAASA